MTGFGDATASVETRPGQPLDQAPDQAPDQASDQAGGGSAGGVEYFVECRSVNSKYFKASVRLPEELQPLEPEIDLAARHALERGTVTVRVTVSDRSTEAALEINHKALDRYAEQLGRSRSVSDGRVAVDAGALLGLPGVLQPPGGEDERLERARAAVLPLIERACAGVTAMRSREGELLDADLRAQLAQVGDLVERIAERAPVAVRSYEQRLRQRIDALIAEAGGEVGEADLVREIAVHAERTDIAEEIARLSGHVAHFRERLDASEGEPVGRTLDFLAQEMLREANTIASKSQDADISRHVVGVKGAIDRIKEQVQNVL